MRTTDIGPRTWLGVVLSLPAIVISLLLMAIYIPRKARWRAGCLEVITTWMFGSPRGQCLGCRIIFYSDAEAWEQGKATPVHERVHAAQGEEWGPLFLVAYPLEFLYRFVVGKFRDPWSYGEMDADRKPPARWWRAYWAMSWEYEARDIVLEWSRGNYEPWGA